jgi:hypothetical protein
MAVKFMLAQNLIKKCDQLIAYAFWLLNHVKQNYTTTKGKHLPWCMPYTNSIIIYFLKCIFYVDHMALLYLISPHWVLEFHVHINAFNLVVKTMLTQNFIKKCDQPIVYASWLFNHAKWNYTTTKREELAMVCALHKFCHYLLLETNLFFMWTTWHYCT